MRKILFTDGAWMIGTSDGDTFIVHKCDHELALDGQTWWFLDRTCCAMCDETFPDAIKGLAMLHDWER